jgi:nicotinate-nucleotide adenylyltransferase
LILAGFLLFGGSFDPVHFGHLIVAADAAEQIGAGRVVLIPSAHPPHKQGQNLSPAGQRLEMCRLAVADDPRFEVSDWEVHQPGPNYTLHTVRHFRQALPGEASLYWLIGMDSLAELATWYCVRELLEACTLVTAVRPGFEQPDLARLADLLSPAQVRKLKQYVLQTPLIDIGATDVRTRARAGRSIRYLVPEPVRQYILERRLYRDD